MTDLLRKVFQNQQQHFNDAFEGVLLLSEVPKGVI